MLTGFCVSSYTLTTLKWKKGASVTFSSFVTEKISWKLVYKNDFPYNTVQQKREGDFYKKSILWLWPQKWV